MTAQSAFQHVQPGDLITAGFTNALIDALIDLETRVSRLEGSTATGGALVITGLVPAGPVSVGDDLQILGRNFGYSLGQQRVFFNSARATVFRTGSSDTNLIVQIPDIPDVTAAGAATPVTLTVANQTSSDTRQVNVSPAPQLQRGSIFLDYLGPDQSTLTPTAGSQFKVNYRLESQALLPTAVTITPLVAGLRTLPIPQPGPSPSPTPIRPPTNLQLAPIDVTLHPTAIQTSDILQPAATLQPSVLLHPSTILTPSTVLAPSTISPSTILQPSTNFPPISVFNPSVLLPPIVMFPPGLFGPVARAQVVDANGQPLPQPLPLQPTQVVDFSVLVSIPDSTVSNTTFTLACSATGSDGTSSQDAPRSFTVGQQATQVDTAILLSTNTTIPPGALKGATISAAPGAQVIAQLKAEFTDKAVTGVPYNVSVQLSAGSNWIVQLASTALFDTPASYTLTSVPITQYPAFVVSPQQGASTIAQALFTIQRQGSNQSQTKSYTLQLVSPVSSPTTSPTT